VKLVDAGTKVAATSRSRSMVTWQTRCSSTLGWQVAPHSSSSLSAAPLAAVALRLTRVPTGYTPLQVPMASEALVPPTTVQLMPPRLATMVPPAELLPAPIVRR
jgi:hypothetical protein